MIEKVIFDVIGHWESDPDLQLHLLLNTLLFLKELKGFDELKIEQAAAVAAVSLTFIAREKCGKIYPFSVPIEVMEYVIERYDRSKVGYISFHFRGNEDEKNLFRNVLRMVIFESLIDSENVFFVIGRISALVHSKDPVQEICDRTMKERVGKLESKINKIMLLEISKEKRIKARNNAVCA